MFRKALTHRATTSTKELNTELGNHPLSPDSRHPITPPRGTSFSYFNFTAPVITTTPATAPFSFAPALPLTTTTPAPPRKKAKTKKPTKPIKKPKTDKKKQRPVKYKKPSKSFFKSKSVPQSLTYAKEKKSSKPAPLKVSPRVTPKESSGVTFKSLVGVEREPGREKVEVPTLITPVPVEEAELKEQPIVKVPRPTKSPKKRKKEKSRSKKKGSPEKSKKTPKSFKFEEEKPSGESGVTFKAWVGVKMSSGGLDVLNEIPDTDDGNASSGRRSKSSKSSDGPRPRPGRRRGRRGKKGGAQEEGG